jgi:hypothetical protein
MKKHFYAILFLQALVVGTTYAQYQSKTVKVKTEEYEGTVEACTNCKITADPSKTYKWIKAGKLGESKGSFQGELIHGKVELFTMGMGGEKEMVEKGTYFTGLKDGKIEEYAFGNLEHIETHDKGELKEIEYYQPEKKILDHKITFTSSASVFPRKIVASYYLFVDHYLDKKPTGKKHGRRLEMEGYQIPNGNSFSIIYEGKFRRYTLWQDVEMLRQEGAYSKNRRTGEWKIYYGDGVVGVTKYENDEAVSEQFLKDGKPFTGVVKDLARDFKTELVWIEVKNGVRNGKMSEDFKENEKKELVAGKVTEYVDGKIKDSKTLNLADFLKGHKISKEAEYTQECDSKGSGTLFLDRIIYTDKGAFVYFHTVNLLFAGGSSISTAAPGKEGAFTALDLTSKKVYKVTQIFNLAIQPSRQSANYGEANQFVLYFEGLTQTVKKISFVEGDPENPFTVDEKTGTTTYSWGCYDLIAK